MTRTRLATIAACGAVVCWGVGNAFNKKVGVSGLTLAFWRSVLGSVVMISLLYATGGRLSWRVFRHSALSGVMFGTQIAVFFTAIHRTGITNATMIGALNPVLVMFAAWRWLGERVSRFDVVLGIGALCGVAIVIVGGSGGPQWSPSGDLLAFVALFIWAGYFLMIKRARLELNPFEFMAGVVTVAAVVLTPIALVVSDDVGSMTSADWAWCVAIVLLPGAAGHLLNTWAVHYLPVSRQSQLSLGIPVVALAAAAMLVGERVNARQLLGVAVTMAALALLIRRTSSGV